MKIIILCGGRGIRASPLTKNIPKTLIKIGKKPFLSYIINYFFRRDFRDIILCTGFHGEDIKKWAENNSTCNFEISHKPNATITQRIHACKDIVSDTFMVCYGDTVADIDIEKLLEFHNSHDGIATITTYKHKLPYGVVEDITELNYLVSSFKEKKLLPMRISIGFMIFDKEAFDYIKPRTTVQSFLNKLAKDKKLYAFRHEGNHITFNTPNDVEKINIKLLERVCEVNDR